MIADATIEVARIYDFQGGIERREFKWVGGKITKVSIYLLGDEFVKTKTDKFLASGETFFVGPFQLKVLEIDLVASFIYATQDNWQGQIRYLVHRWSRLLDKIYRRSIITLAVWRLASYEAHRVPSWKDVYLLNKFRKMEV